MKKFICLISLVLSSCTYSITMIHTEGEASDVVDDTSTPTANVNPQITVPASIVGK
jgi:hypothetical protein